MATKKKRRQFNVQVEPTYTRMLKRDAKKFEKSLPVMVGAILGFFYLVKDEAERARVFAKLPRKIRGRKIESV